MRRSRSLRAPGGLLLALIGSSLLAGCSGAVATVQAAPSPRVTRVASPSIDCTLAPVIDHAGTSGATVWKEAVAASKAAKYEGGYQAVYRRAAGRVIAIQTDLRKTSPPADATLRRARLLMLESLAKLLTAVKQLSVSTYGQSVASESAAVARAGALANEAGGLLRVGCTL
jgi:hypothetical protein